MNFLVSGPKLETPAMPGHSETAVDGAALSDPRTSDPAADSSAMAQRLRSCSDRKMDRSLLADLDESQRTDSLAKRAPRPGVQPLAVGQQSF